MTSSIHTLHFGDTAIEYTLIYAARKTLAIHVHPDRSVTVKAPAGSDFAALPPRQPPRRYVSGESFWYLGRHYRLKVSEGEREWVKLTRGYLEVTTPNKANTAYVQAQVEAWLRRQAQRHFHERVAALLPRFKPLALPEPELAVRAMKSRWGSCTGKGKITLNLHLMRAPKPCVDYVVVHELCHLVELNHGKGFYALMDRVMPDWRKRREQLKHVEII